MNPRRSVGMAAAKTGDDERAVRRHRPDHMIALYMALLMLLGLVIMYAIGPQRANLLNNIYGSEYGDNYFFLRQLSSVMLGLAGFAALYFTPYKLLIKHADKFLLFGFLACLVLAIADWTGMAIVQESLGATRWFNFGPLSFQPAELLKFGVLIFAAGFLGVKVKKGDLNDYKETLLPISIIAGLALLFVVILQKDLGTGIALTSILAAMLFVAGINTKNAAIIVAGAVVLGALLVVSAPHRVSRVTAFLEGDNTTTTEAGTYHAQQAKIAIGTGGLFGLGIGNSVQATGYLPEAINDSVFAILGETFGFVGLMIILALFVGVLLRMTRVMEHLADIRLKLLVAGVFGWFGSHVILNIAAMTGLLPITGITLPLLSFGGTSMVFISAALGLVFQLSRYTVHSSRLQEKGYEGISSRRGVRRSRYSSRSSN
jgi:cell division protein FtsW